MKGKWTSFLLLFSVLMIGLPGYAYARGEYGDFISSLLITLIIIAIVFLILREVVCWYWKINETLSVLKEIRDLLASKSPNTTKKATQKKTQLGNPKNHEPNEPDENDGASPFCYHCGADIPPGSSQCQSCGKEL